MAACRADVSMSSRSGVLMLGTQVVCGQMSQMMRLSISQLCDADAGRGVTSREGPGGRGNGGRGEGEGRRDA